jgi:hypothetical protein
MRGGRGGSGIVVIKFKAMSGTKGIAGSTAIAPAGSGTTLDTPSLTLDATTESATPTLDMNFTTAMTSFPKNIWRYNISTHDALGVEFDRTASRKKRVKKTINADKFSMEMTANNAASGTIGDLVTFGDFTFAANATVSGEHTIATNFDGTTSNVYMDGRLVSQTTPTVTSGAKLLTIGEYYSGRIKDFKFWNLAQRFFIPVLISPKFSSTTALASDYKSTYGWDTSSGWEITESTNNGSSHTVLEAFDKLHNENNCWHSANSSGNMASTPQWIAIKYPTAVTVFKYKIWDRGRSSDDNRYFPRIWKLQGSNDGSSWTDVGSAQQEDSWPYTVNVANMKEYTVSNTTAYTRYRLRITSGRYNNSTTNNDYNFVALSGWELYSQES